MLKWPLVIENRRELFELVVVRHSEADHNTQCTMHNALIDAINDGVE